MPASHVDKLFWATILLGNHGSTGLWSNILNKIRFSNQMLPQGARRRLSKLLSNILKDKILILMKMYPFLCLFVINLCARRKLFASSYTINIDDRMLWKYVLTWKSCLYVVHHLNYNNRIYFLSNPFSKPSHIFVDSYFLIKIITKKMLHIKVLLHRIKDTLTSICQCHKESRTKKSFFRGSTTKALAYPLKLSVYFFCGSPKALYN